MAHEIKGMGDFASVGSSSADHFGGFFSLSGSSHSWNGGVVRNTNKSLSVELLTGCQIVHSLSGEMQHNDGTAMVHAKLEHLSWWGLLSTEESLIRLGMTRGWWPQFSMNVVKIAILVILWQIFLYCGRDLRYSPNSYVNCLK